MNQSAHREPAADLDGLAARAREGERAALEALVRAVERDVRALALRFLWHPEDAEDASQEILIRIVTGLGGFRGESRFRTWAYRVACNTLLNLRRGRAEQQPLSFDAMGEDLATGLSEAPPADMGVEHAVLLEEVKVGCTLAMLLCLDRPHRLAYVLGEILELDHAEAAEVLEIAPAAFRKRLSRARAAITTFTMSHCGLVNRENACRCRKRVTPAIALKRVDPSHLLFASDAERARRFPRVLAEIRRLEETRRAAALYRSHPEPQPSEPFASWLRKLLDSEPVG